MVEVKKTAREITKSVDVDETRNGSSEDTDEDDDDDFIGPPIPSGDLSPTSFVHSQFKRFLLDLKMSTTGDDTVERIDLENKLESDDESENENEPFIPLTHEATMKHGNKAITALSVDPSGARLASGIK